MPSVVINEKDYTVYNVYGNNSNIVWIPGFAITGPYDTPVLLNSVSSLKSTFGDTPPAEKYATSATSSTTSLCTGWEFACQMLNKGFKVLYQRIAPYNYDAGGKKLLDTINGDLLKSATTSIADSTKAFKFGFTEKYGGTFGNRLNITFVINVNRSKLYLKIVDTGNSNAVLEYKDICTIKYNTDDGSVYLDYLLTFAKGFVSAVNSSEYIEFVTDTDYAKTVANFNSSIVTTLSDGGTGTFTVNSTTGEIEYSGKVASENWISSHIINANIINSVSALKSYDRFSIELGKSVTDESIAYSDGTHLGLDYTYNDALDYKPAGASTGYTILADTIAKKLDAIADKILYDVKFVTLGNISVSGFDIMTTDGNDMFKTLTAFCAERGDCCAILNPGYDVEQTSVRDEFGDYFKGSNNASYSAVFAPWCTMTIYSMDNKWCSPAMVFLTALADSVQNGNPVYLPPAGVNRATLSSVTGVQYPVGSAVLADWQNKDKPVNINPIMYLNNYGYVIFGQRTLYDVSDELVGTRSALQELGVRLTVLECKKKIREVAIGLVFEYNNIHTWNSFKSGVTPLFDEMLKNGAIQRYKVIMDDTTTSSDDIDDNTIHGVVKIVPGRAVEDFIISFELYRSGVTFDNEENV